MSQVNRHVNDTNRDLWIRLGLLVLALVTVTATVLRRQVHRPLVQLLDHINKVGDDDQLAPLPVKGRDELGQVVMKTTTFALVRGIFALVAGAPMTAGSETVKGSGTVTAEGRTVTSFSAITLTGVGTLTIRQTGHERVTVRAEDNILPLLATELRGRTFRLGAIDDTSFAATRPIEFIVEVRDLDRLEIRGTGRVELAQINAERLTVRSSGTGNVVAAGEAEILDLEFSGTGVFDGAALATAQATVRQRGTGKVVLNVSQALDVSLIGTGTVEYIGNPTVNKMVTGTGGVRQRAGG